MNSSILIAAAAPGNPVTEIATQFGVTWQLLISQTVLFVIVALVLKKFAYAPILKMLDERKRRIAESMANADQIKKDLASAQAKAQEILNQANAQGVKMIEEARAAAAQVQERETQKAIAAATDIVNKTRQATEAEHARMLTELRREVGRLVVTTTSKVTGKVLTPDDQNRLAEEANRQLAA